MIFRGLEEGTRTLLTVVLNHVFIQLYGLCQAFFISVGLVKGDKSMTKIGVIVEVGENPGLCLFSGYGSKTSQ